MMVNQLEDDGGSSLDNAPKYELYIRRYFILLVLVLVQISNAMIWISYAPVADYTSRFYGINLDLVNYLSLVFMVVTSLFGFFAAFILDYIGLRAGLIIGAWINCVGAGVKLLSTYNSILPIPYGAVLAFVGQSIAALSQPFNMFAPTKLAALWFPEEHRALANTVATMANPIGILIGSLISPAVVNDVNNLPLQFQRLLGIHCGPALLSGVLALVIVTASAPPSPPSASASEGMPFKESVKKILRSKSYWILMMTGGAGLALFTIVTTLIQQMLCPYGYDDKFAGLCSALMIAFGLVGAGITGVFVDQTKKFEETLKTCWTLATVSGCFFTIIIRYPDQKVLVGLACSLFGFFGFGFFPVALELGVEITYPVAEATSTAFIIISGQLQGIIYLVIMLSMATDFSPAEHVCSGAVQDFTNANIFFIGMVFIFGVIFILGLKANYRRLRAEQETAAKRILIYSPSAAASPPPEIDDPSA